MFRQILITRLIEFEEKNLLILTLADMSYHTVTSLTSVTIFIYVIMLSLGSLLSLFSLLSLLSHLCLNQTLSIWLGIQFSQRYSQIKDWRPNIFLEYFALHDPETQGVQELILDLFKVHSWLTYRRKSVRFWWYFYAFHENGHEVLFKIRLQTPIKTILEAVLFMYLLANTNSARI